MRQCLKPWSKPEIDSMGGNHVPHKHLHSRISYLYQAASYLSEAQIRSPCRTISGDCESLLKSSRNASQGPQTDLGTLEANSVLGEPFPPFLAPTTCLARHLVVQLRGISLKAQIRLAQNMKHSLCKHCHEMLKPGGTSATKIENHSRKARKPWADVLVVTCSSCTTSRRFPVGAKRQRPRKKRLEKALPSVKVTPGQRNS